MKLKFLILLIALSSYKAFALHPINLSVGDIVYKDGKLYLKIKFFTDDLQATVSQYCKYSVDIMNKGIDANSEKCIDRYILSKFEVYVNGSLLKWTYKRAYLREAVTYVEYEIKFNTIKSVKTLKIKNTLLFDVIAEQKNIVNVNLFGPNAIKVVKFDNEAEEHSKEIIYSN